MNRLMAGSSKTLDKQWQLLFQENDSEVRKAVEEIASELNITKTTAKLLYIRGYHTPSEAKRFYRMDNENLHDPFEMKDMALAVDRINRAIEQNERIAIYGDYDVDGVTATSLLFLYLKKRGADVGYYIPSRSKEGFGVSVTAIDSLLENGVKLIVTVDTGVTAVQEFQYAESLGIDAVITDHHECLDELPKVAAVVNPHRSDDNYPFKDLAGVGVAFKLVCAMEMDRCKKMQEDIIDGIIRVCNDYSDLVALGSIADVMPVADENRLLVAKGLSLIEHQGRLGIRALIEASNNNCKTGNTLKINSSFIGFTIAPRINAAGRVSDATIAVELLLSDSENEAQQLAKVLCQLNTKRQEEENSIAEEAFQMIDSMPEKEKKYVIVLDHENWHQGIIGIVSSRITDRYAVPSILITYDCCEKGVGKGSGRSVKGLNLVEALSSCQDLLVRFGGHELAAGLSVKKDNVSALRKRLNEYAEKHFNGEAGVVKLDADCEVSAAELTMNLALEIEKLEPFGTGNPMPQFVLRNATVKHIISLSGGKHTKFIIEKDNLSYQAVWFNHKTSEIPFSENEHEDFLFRFGINEYNGLNSLQMIIQDSHPAKSTKKTEFCDAKKRFEEISKGAHYSNQEKVLPDRSDFKAVYQGLKQKDSEGNKLFKVDRFLEEIKLAGYTEMNYMKMLVCFRVFQDFSFFSFKELSDGLYSFEMNHSPGKKDLERSLFLGQIRSQKLSFS